MTEAAFPITTMSVAAVTRVQIRASLGGVAREIILTVVPAASGGS
jgi:hypothetical protein